MHCFITNTDQFSAKNKVCLQCMCDQFCIIWLMAINQTADSKKPATKTKYLYPFVAKRILNIPSDWSNMRAKKIKSGNTTYRNNSCPNNCEKYSISIVFVLTIIYLQY